MYFHNGRDYNTSPNHRQEANLPIFNGRLFGCYGLLDILSATFPTKSLVEVNDV
ncbi:MAG: hypothetical protein HC804_11160 [Anaerolineae bacterium]|nr:hypothetical protein [Anaerolineae bacterium]